MIPSRPVFVIVFVSVGSENCGGRRPNHRDGRDELCQDNTFISGQVNPGSTSSPSSEPLFPRTERLPSWR